jgi:hypothetical protein
MNLDKQLPIGTSDAGSAFNTVIAQGIDYFQANGELRPEGGLLTIECSRLMVSNGRVAILVVGVSPCVSWFDRFVRGPSDEFDPEVSSFFPLRWFGAVPIDQAAGWTYQFFQDFVSGAHHPSVSAGF